MASGNVIDELKTLITDQVEARIEKRKWNMDVEANYSIIVGGLFNRIEDLLQPLRFKLEEYEDHYKDVVSEVFEIKRREASFNSKFELKVLKNILVIQPAGKEQNKEEPSTLFITLNGNNIERLFVAKEHEGYYWQILRSSYPERLLDTHILNWFEKLLVDAEV